MSQKYFRRSDKSVRKLVTIQEISEVKPVPDACDLVGLCLNNLNLQNTYMFELVSPYNRIVVPHESIDLYNIGTRDNVTLHELEVDIGIKKTKY